MGVILLDVLALEVALAETDSQTFCGFEGVYFDLYQSSFYYPVADCHLRHSQYFLEGLGLFKTFLYFSFGRFAEQFVLFFLFGAGVR